MRFARHLAAVLATVAVVVALGLALEHSSAVARLIGVPPGASGVSQREIQLSNPRPGAVVRRPGGKNGPVFVAARSGGAPPDLGASSEVVHATLLEALIIAVVAGLGAEGRRYRRQHRPGRD